MEYYAIHQNNVNFCFDKDIQIQQVTKSKLQKPDTMCIFQKKLTYIHLHMHRKILLRIYKK